MIYTQQVSVGTSPTRLDPTTGGAIPQGSYAVRNRGAAAVYLGGPAVATGTGWQLDPGETFTAELWAGDALYAVTASGTVTCAVLQTGGR